MAAGIDPPAITGSARSELIVDALHHAVIAIDDAGRIIGWNAAAEARFGWTFTEVLGLSASEILRPVTDDRQTNDLIATIQQGEVWDGEVHIALRDGGSVPIRMVLTPVRDDHRRIVGAVGSPLDFTDQGLAERRADDLNDHLRLALDAGRLGTWRWNLATGAVEWDATMEQLYGLAPGDFDGTYDSWLALRDPDELSRAKGVLDQAIATREPFELEHRVVWPDGSVHWLLGRGKVTVDEHGVVTGAIGCTGDITGQKTSELESARRAAAVTDAATRQRQQHERLVFLARISDAALGTNDHVAFMTTVAHDAVPHLGDWCAIRFAPDPARVPDVVVAHVDPSKVAWLRKLIALRGGQAGARAGATEVMRTGVTEFVEVADETYLESLLAGTDMDRDQARAMFDDFGLTSIITVPLRTKRGVIGTMQFATAESGRRYNADDVTLAEAAAGRVAEAIDNMWLTEQQRHIAATLQSALLPPALPVVPGLGLAVRYWAAGAATEVGGDFYDVFPIGDQRWAVVIGDVCGTGPNAAAVTTITRHTIRAAAKHGVDHAGVLDWLNEAVIAGNRDRFCTALYATLERRSDAPAWTFTVISGGHPLPVIARALGVVETVGEAGTLIGVFPSVRAVPVQVTLEPGDTVVLYTDGVTDVRPPHGLGPHDVEALVQRSARDAAAADDVVEALGSALHDALPIPQRGDDIAVVVLRVDGDAKLIRVDDDAEVSFAGGGAG